MCYPVIEQVSWSYHIVLHNRDKAATSGYNSGVELREVEEGSEGRDV